MAAQAGPHCKFSGCKEPVVGHSTTGTGRVCKTHNLQEWGHALSRNRSYRQLGVDLLADAQAMQKRLDDALHRLQKDGAQLTLPVGGPEAETQRTTA